MYQPFVRPVNRHIAGELDDCQGLVESVQEVDKEGRTIALPSVWQPDRSTVLKGRWSWRMVHRSLEYVERTELVDPAFMRVISKVAHAYHGRW